MKLESIKSPKFNPLTNSEMLSVRGGDSGSGSEQDGIPRYDEKLECYIIPMRFWSSDSFKDGVWCYENLTTGEIYSPKLNPR